ncbi:MAG: hypothetical protein IPM92_03615 [Saprospiraceae bacterium]|nr:hypothetical protein [Saprospiraceae bacterium]
MKSILSLMAFVAILMASCQQESLVETGLETGTLELTGNNDESGTDEGLNADLGADPSTMGKKKHRRDSLCKPIAIEDLPASITDYIASNYANVLAKRACELRNGNIIVLIQLGEKEFKILEFGPDGTFIKELDPKKKGPKGKRKHLKPVDPNTLPSLITEYLDANYQGNVLKRAGSTKSGEYMIAIEVNGLLKVLLFDANGNFVKELK